MSSGGYDISASYSESTTQANQLGGGAWIVGGNGGTKWLPLALVALGGLALWLFFRKK
jgi:hypothetical protein